MLSMKTDWKLVTIGFMVSIVMAQPPIDWTVNPSGYEHIMTVTGVQFK